MRQQAISLHFYRAALSLIATLRLKKQTFFWNDILSRVILMKSLDCKPPHHVTVLFVQAHGIQPVHRVKPLPNHAPASMRSGLLLYRNVNNCFLQSIKTILALRVEKKNRHTGMT